MTRVHVFFLFKLIISRDHHPFIIYICIALQDCSRRTPFAKNVKGIVTDAESLFSAQNMVVNRNRTVTVIVRTSIFLFYSFFTFFFL